MSILRIGLSRKILCLKFPVGETNSLVVAFIFSVLLHLIRKLLANFWARGTALQYCFNPSSIDFFIVVYFGSIMKGAVFDPDLLSDFVVQVKFKQDADTNAERKMRRGAIPTNGALPYLAILMELGTESAHRETGSKLLSTAPGSASSDSQFQLKVADWMTAVSELAHHKKAKKATHIKELELQKNVDEKRISMDSCNRYSITARGASSETYGILEEAEIAGEFATLLNTTAMSAGYTPPKRALASGKT